MLDTNNNDNTVIQWMSDGYLRRKKKSIKDIPVIRDEYCIVIENGKISSVMTETEYRNKQGFLHNLFSKKADRQVAMVDTARRSLSVPFEAHSKDRDLIRGTVDLFVGIDPENIEMSMRLLKEPRPYGSIADDDGYAEVWLDDIGDLLRKNIEYIIDTDALMSYTADEINAARGSICVDVISALNSKTPYWFNYGLTVNYSTITIDDNRYEELERFARQTRLDAREREIKTSDSADESESRVRGADILSREKAAMELNEYIASVSKDAAKQSKVREIKRQAKLAEISDDSEIAVSEMEAKSKIDLMVIYHQREIKRLEAESTLDEGEKEIKIKQLKARLAEIDREEKRKEVEGFVAVKRTEFGFEIDKKKAEYDLEKKRLDDDAERTLSAKEREAKLLKEMSDHDEKMEELKESNRHDEVITNVNADVRKTEIGAQYNIEVAKAENRAAAAEAHLSGYKSAIESEHGRAIENLDKTREIVEAASGRGGERKTVTVCPECRAEVPAAAKFCPRCGKPLAQKKE